MSHCPAKGIRIDRTEVVEAGGNAKGNIKGADLLGNLDYGQVKGNYYSYSNPNGTIKETSRDDYFWIDKSLMRSIDSLTEQGSINQTYKYDFTFGLSIAEAKTIGLDINMHKKFSYTIYIEC